MFFKSNVLTAPENEAVYLEAGVYSSTADNVVQQMIKFFHENNSKTACMSRYMVPT